MANRSPVLPGESGSTRTPALIGFNASSEAGSALAQQLSVRRIGFLSPADTPGPNHRAFLEQLTKEGFEDGKAVTIEWRWARQRYDLLSAAATELVRLQVDVIVAQTQAAALAAKQATTTIPIVFVGVRMRSDSRG